MSLFDEVLLERHRVLRRSLRRSSMKEKTMLALGRLLGFIIENHRISNWSTRPAWKAAHDPDVMALGDCSPYTSVGRLPSVT